MEEFNLNNFTNRLRQLMYERFPNLKDRGRNPRGSFKHGLYNDEIRDVAFMKNPIVVYGENQLSFDIGNEYAEKYYPYYHILEDTPYILKRNKGMSKTRGSQAKIKKLEKRDYNFVNWNGKTFTQEYKRNIRGKRNRIGKVSHWVTDSQGNEIFINRENNSYLNEHYHYIEKMLDTCVDQLGIDFNLKVMRIQHSDLGEDYSWQSFDDVPTSMLQIFESFK